jgi:hypothetical protein
MFVPLWSASLAFKRNLRRAKLYRRDWLGRSKTQRRKAAAQRRARQRRQVVTWTTTDGRTHRRRFPSKAAADRFARTLRARKAPR